MGFIASFDIGTSAVKGALVARDGSLQHACVQPYPDAATRGSEQDPHAWWDAFLAVLAGWWEAGVDAASIDAVSCCGQMQALIAVDAAGAPVRPAMLHFDARAGAAADAIRALLGADAIWRVTRNPFNATSVLPKLVHLREHEPQAAVRTAQVFFGAKDWLVWQLTGAAVTDPTTAATTGFFDIEQGRWKTGWLARLGVAQGGLPAVAASSDVIGAVTPQAAAATGLRTGCPVVCGVGDAAATTLGAGVVDASRSYAYLGTSGWVARVSGGFNPPGVPLFVLPYLPAPPFLPPPDSSAPGSPPNRILIGPVSNAGGVHRWALELLDASAGSSLADRYAAFEGAVGAAPPDPGLLFLPHLAGERFPVVAPAGGASFAGVSAGTTRPQLMRAALEGVSLSLRWALEALSPLPTPAPAELAAVGGATRSAVWMQILADSLGTTLRVPADAELLPCVGAAAFAAPGLGWAADPAAFVRQRPAGAERRVVPDPQGAAMLQRKSAALRRLHAALTTARDTDG